MKTRILIVDDQQDIRELLRTVLMMRKDVIVVGEAANVQDAIKLCEGKRPDIVLLDIELPDGSGFDLLHHFKSPFFKTIIVTAFSDYIVNALRLSALDYLLKPITFDELNVSIDRISAMIEDEKSQYKLLKDYLAQKPEIDRILIPSDTNKHSLLFKDILYLRSNAGYTVFHCVNHKHVISSKSISYYEEILPEKLFFRTHKSFVVNYHHIAQLPSGRSGTIILNQDKSVELSVRRAPDFREWYKSLTLGGKE
ncbi:MAG: response regulator transcription factor [Bacteroidia bacterium]